MPLQLVPKPEKSHTKMLFLDDVRNPPDSRWDVVRSYEDFVFYIEVNGCPDIVSFDHDLADAHYDMESSIPYDSYKEKTGLHCARYLIEHNLKPLGWVCHSMNPVGKANIRAEMEKFCPGREIRL